MALPGRNDPCPCGSGRKHKHCCLRTIRDITSAGAWAADDRTRALAKLFRFSRRPRFAEGLRLAFALFWAGRLELASPEERRRLEADEQCSVAFELWFVFDFHLPDDEPRGTIASQFLDWSGADLTTAERTWLERMSGSSIRLYEVREVQLDEGLVLSDLETGATVQVKERLATRQLAQWDLLAVRVVTGRKNDLELEGVPYVYPPLAREPILGDLKRQARRVRREIPAGDDVAVYKRLGMLFHHLWLDHVMLRPMPAIVTVEGDPIVFTKVVFEVADPATVSSLLGHHPELKSDGEGGFVWTEPDGSHARMLGNIALDTGRLTLETTSEARAERGRVLLETALGDAVRYRVTRTETLDQALAHQEPAAEAEPELGAEVREVLTGFLEDHYRTWPDHPLPALDGRTPRHAARLKTMRSRVVALLKGLENGMARERRDGRPAIDLGWLWNELGLERPGPADPG